MKLILSASLVSLVFLAIFLLVLLGLWWLLIGRFLPRKPRPVRPTNVVLSPSNGVVVSVAVHAGERVAFGQELCKFEAGGRQNAIRAARPGVIGVLHITEGDKITRGQILIEYQPPERPGTDEPDPSMD
jgi:multidrug efflux pump subunit AcrA (membrane-fusion protein)